MKFDPRGKALLPSGLWVTFDCLDPATTQEEVIAFLMEHGIDLSYAPERVRVTCLPPYSRAKAVVSVPKHIVVSLILWAINGEQLKGKPMYPFVPERELDK